MIVYECSNLNELPSLPKDKKLLTTIGGRGYRCFLIEKNTDDFNFMLANAHRLDDVLKPIYKDSYFLIRQSKDFAVPGFYTIQPMQKKETITALSEGELALLSYLQQNVRIGLKQNLNIELFGLYTEEKQNERFMTYLIPYHVDQLKQNNLSVSVYQPHIAQYLRSYDFSSVQSKMKIFNNKMAYFFNSAKICEDIQAIKNIFELKEPPAQNNSILRGRYDARI